MNHTLLIKRQAQKKLQTLSRPDRNRIAEKMFMLSQNPDDPNLDIKKLAGEPY